MKKSNVRGFTLIELMIVVAILALLVMIVAPRFSSLIRKTQESMTKDGLSKLRSTISRYYVNTEGQYPTDDLSSLVPKYLNKIPYAKLPPYHYELDAVTVKIENDGTINFIDDRGGWFYNNDPNDADWGALVVNCTHPDISGKIWSDY
jgi:prepilin-type N-terminal cleavage/methylation domain-containing protein